jgi:hypothetical protein
MKRTRILVQRLTTPDGQTVTMTKGEAIVVADGANQIVQQSIVVSSSSRNADVTG